MSAPRTFWNDTRYDRRFWVLAYATLAAVAALLFLFEDHGAADRILRGLIVGLLLFCSLYKLWGWRREGRWIRRPSHREPGQ